MEDGENESTGWKCARDVGHIFMNPVKTRQVEGARPGLVLLRGRWKVAHRLVVEVGWRGGYS